jgi:hypothetical protein
LNYDEQLKIPVRHEYQNGVLKTLVPWTGDVWKIMYHILSVYSQYVEFNYFYHPYYRGVAVLQIKESFQILETELDLINNYNYTNDFAIYIDLIKNFKERQNNIKYTRIPITIISDTDEDENEAEKSSNV